jgi:hypothetical protein
MPENMHALLRNIERKDRRFRFFQGLFLGAIGLGIVVLLLLQFNYNARFQAQSAERARGLKTLTADNKRLGEDNKRLSEQTNRYIQCVARFFATTDRANLVLTNLDKCNFTQNGKPVPGVDASPTAGDGSNAPAASGQGATAAPRQSTQPSGSSGGGGTNPGPAQPDVLRVITKPVCDVSTICVLQ